MRYAQAALLYAVDLDELYAFLCLSQTLHFAQASRQCHLSPSALTRTVQRLESELGCRLFERDRKGVRLTLDGERFQKCASGILDQMAAYRELQEKQNLAGRIEIYCSVTGGHMVLPPLLRVFRERYPEVHIAIRTGHSGYGMEELSSGTVDLTISGLPDKLASGLVETHLIDEPIAIIVPRLICPVREQLRFKHDKVERKSLRRVPWILPRGVMGRQRIDDWFASSGFRVEIEADGNEAVMPLVASGCGVGALPRFTLDSSSLRNEVEEIHLGDVPAPLRVGACTRETRLESPVVSAFWQLLRDEGEATILEWLQNSFQSS